MGNLYTFFLEFKHYLCCSTSITQKAHGTPSALLKSRMLAYEVFYAVEKTGESRKKHRPQFDGLPLPGHMPDEFETRPDPTTDCEVSYPSNFGQIYSLTSEE